MVDERETTNGHACDLNCSMNDKGALLADGSTGGVTFGEEASAEGLRIYKRRKGRKMSNSDQKTKTEFDNKIKAGDGSASNQDFHRSSFDTFPKGSGECYFTQYRKIVLQKMYESLNGPGDGIGECIRNALATFPESGCTSAVKESLDSVERSDKRTRNSNRSESLTNSELCGRGLFDILTSDKFSELCDLIMKNFGIVGVHRLLDLNAINTKMKNGDYETSPVLYQKDIQQILTKIQQVGTEMLTIATSLSDISRAHYEQYVRKPSASNCHGCGENADLGDCLVCDSCEDMYHLSCSDLVGTQIPPKSWYCATCVSNGIGSPHDNCIVCEKLKSTAPISTLNGSLTTEEQENITNGLNESIHDEGQVSKICYICKSEVNSGDNFRTCGHALCGHKFYHYRCLTSKQLGVCGPCWYCPSCLCRKCLIDKDDDKIVLCDSCDQAYHIYCTTPELNSIPKGSWFCGKCDRELKRIKTMKRVYENMQKKVKVEENGVEQEAGAVAVVNECEDGNKSGGLDMLVTAAKTLSNQETMTDSLRRNTI